MFSVLSLNPAHLSVKGYHTAKRPWDGIRNRCIEVSSIELTLI